MRATDIAQFPDFKAVSLDQRSEIMAALALTGGGKGTRPAQGLISENSFANLYLFRDAHNYRVCRWQGLLLIIAIGYGGELYGFPPWGEGPVEEGARLLCNHLEESGGEPLLSAVPKAMVEQYFSRGWEASSERDQFDYVYLVSEIADPVGKKNHKRRNRINKFLKEYGQRYEYTGLQPRHVGECALLADRWCEVRCSLERPSTYSETGAAIEGLERREELELSGGVVLIDGEVAAYCLGEELDNETFVVHFEKARPGIDGLAQLLSRDFCAETISDFKFVNRAQDLGDSGLRQAKMGYNPVHMAEKFTLKPCRT